MNELSQQIIRSENYELNYYPDITFIIPAYNEEKRISYVIDDLSNYIGKNKLNWNIITSIDGTDNTKNIVNDYSSKYNFIIMDTSYMVLPAPPAFGFLISLCANHKTFISGQCIDS